MRHTPQFQSLVSAARLLEEKWYTWNISDFSQNVYWTRIT